MIGDLNPDHLKQWREKYDAARRLYFSFACGRPDAAATLRELGFKGEALDIELTEWTRERAKRGK